MRVDHGGEDSTDASEPLHGPIPGRTRKIASALARDGTAVVYDKDVTFTWRMRTVEAAQCVFFLEKIFLDVLAYQMITAFAYAFVEDEIEEGGTIRSWYVVVLVVDTSTRSGDRGCGSSRKILGISLLLERVTDTALPFGAGAWYGAGNLCE